MININTMTKPLLLVLLSSLVTPALAAPRMLYTHDRIRFMSGGIGHDEVLEMRPFAKKYTLNLLFSEGEEGTAVTGLNVDIYNENNEQVFKLKGAKPVLYINLPVGNYTVLASNNGLKLRHKFSIEEKTTQRIILNWKRDLVEDTPPKE